MLCPVGHDVVCTDFAYMFLRHDLCEHAHIPVAKQHVLKHIAQRLVGSTGYGAWSRPSWDLHLAVGLIWLA